ncbi:hypothetical protein ONS96_004511 [Cadophora gregata f. sp. sojae]|nr:hypothetical protein ONS96_004511 [Cadophora gregata f. sp. sojae]
MTLHPLNSDSVNNRMPSPSNEPRKEDNSIWILKPSEYLAWVHDDGCVSASHLQCCSAPLLAVSSPPEKPVIPSPASQPASHAHFPGPAACPCLPLDVTAADPQDPLAAVAWQEVRLWSGQVQDSSPAPASTEKDKPSPPPRSTVEYSSSPTLPQSKPNSTLESQTDPKDSPWSSTVGGLSRGHIRCSIPDP